MNARPMFSIVTPTFNRKAALHRAIRSVQCQTLSDYEHLIIDDCSQDGTEDLIREIADSRIRYIKLDHWQGANAARNVGIDLAKAEWVAFLDSDDEYLPHRLATATHAAECVAPNDVLISSFQTIKRGTPRPAVNPKVYLNGQEFEHALMAHAVYIAGSSITVRRRTLIKAGRFDPAIRRMQDREVLLRLSRLGGAQLLSDVDWIKHPSSDSISAPRAGFIEALDDLLLAHPDLAKRRRETVGYVIARCVLADLLSGHWREAVHKLKKNTESQVFGFHISELVGAYRSGWLRRRELVSQWRQIASAEAAGEENPNGYRLSSLRMTRQAA